MTSSADYTSEIDALGKVLEAVSGLSPDGQTFVLKTVMDRLGIAATTGVSVQGNGATFGTSGVLHSPASAPPGGNIEPKRFMEAKRPETDVEKVACLAYYLNHYRSTPHFKTADITAMNVEAAQKPLSNASYSVGNAEQAGLITNAGKRGDKQLTTYGEKIVDALPDREAVKLVQEAERKRHARRKPNKKASKAKK